MSWTNRLMSPSRVDNYLQYMSGVLYNFGDMPEYTTEMFIDKLLGLDFTTTYQMEAGTAVHKMIEAAPYDEVWNNAYVDDWEIEIFPEIVLNYPPVREFPIKGTIAGFEIKGTIDAASATTAHDLKTTSKIDIDRYMGSAQWKMYCLLGRFDHFIYDIFKVNVDAEQRAVHILDYEQLILTPYLGMEKEITRILLDYNSLLLKLQPAILARIRELATDGIKVDKSKFI